MKATAAPVTMPNMGTSTRDCKNSGENKRECLVESKTQLNMSASCLCCAFVFHLEVDMRPVHRPARVRLLWAAPTLLLAFTDTFPNRLLRLTRSV